MMSVSVFIVDNHISKSPPFEVYNVSLMLIPTWLHSAYGKGKHRKTQARGRFWQKAPILAFI